ncbi:MAG: hypothetical protein F6J89_17850 [Symploca sp. SIO1C4]|uniref:Uncharacterized protein n=1 Tax=Symploca sp. SIO1C4 TaxID=2607765 RepID=A0A6B3NHD5_9CYAN|nr:hypothetical protein [Symploca sp. SIO1C4]
MATQITVTLEELLQIPTLDTIAQRLIATLQGAVDADGNNPFVVNDFEPGSIPKTIIDMLAAGLLDYAAATVPLVAAGATAEDAAAKWLTRLAEQNFALNRFDPTSTEQRVQMWFDDGVGPTTKGPGFFIIENPLTGNRYRNKNEVTVPVGTPDPNDGRVDAIFVAEGPGASYADVAGSLNTLVTALPGLNVSNGQTDFTAVSQVGSSLGTVQPVRTVAGTAPTPHTVRIHITEGAQVGAGSLTYELDGSGKTQIIAPIPGSLPLVENDDVTQTGITVNFANHASSTPSFRGGSVFTFVSPAGPIVVAGRDEETDNALRARIRGRWSGLSDVPTRDRHAQWAFDASAEQDLGVTKVRVRADEFIAGEADVLIAGDVNPLPVSSQTAIQTYIDARLSITDKADVRLANAIAVVAAATVLVPVGQLATVQAAAEKAWAEYIRDLPIGGDPSLGGVVSLDRLHQTLMNAGAISVNGESLAATGRGPDSEQNLILLDDDVATVFEPLSTSPSVVWQSV